MAIEKPSNENKLVGEQIRDAVAPGKTQEERMREILDWSVAIHRVQEWIGAMGQTAIPTESEALENELGAAQRKGIELDALQVFLTQTEKDVEAARAQPESIALFARARASVYRLTAAFEVARREAQRE